MNSQLRELQSLLSSNGRLLITDDEYRKALLELLPLTQGALVGNDYPTYKKIVSEELSALSLNNDINLTDQYTADDTPVNSLAYYRIKGLITSSYYWRFSTKEFEQDLLHAEQNPGISCHFLHITSGGGEAWYLDRLSETMRSLSKPIYVFIEKLCGSAAYYIACHGSVVKALTPNDLIGCIGTMISFWNLDSYFESIGFKKIEEYATKSDLKNKKYNDLNTGKPKQFIEEELNPLQEQFESTVRGCRPQIAALPEDHPVVRGETYMGNIAQEVGLIDGIIKFDEALEEAYDLGIKWSESQLQQRNRALSLI